MKNPTPRFGRFLLPLALCFLAAPAAHAALNFQNPSAELSLATWSGNGAYGSNVRFDIHKTGTGSEWSMSVTGGAVFPYYTNGQSQNRWQAKSVSPRFSLGRKAPALNDYSCTKRVKYDPTDLYQVALHHGYRPAHAFGYQPTHTIEYDGELLVMTDKRGNFVIIDHVPRASAACLFLTGTGWKAPLAYATRRVLPTMRLFAGPSE